MTAPKYLFMSGNNFNPTIPSCLYGFARLEFLKLRVNNFEGVISSSFGKLTSVVYLDLSYNVFEGKVTIIYGKSLQLGGNSFGLYQFWWEGLGSL